MQTSNASFPLPLRLRALVMKGARGITATNGLLASTAAALITRWHVNFVFIEQPHELREYAGVYPTRLMLEGINPFAAHAQPEALPLYGALYPLFMAVVSPIFGAGYAAHRLVSLGFLMAACWLVYRIARHVGSRSSLAVVAALLAYAILGQRSHCVARPDSLGLFLFLASFRAAQKENLKTSAALGIAAFFAKPYFIVAVPIVGLYLALCKPRATAAAFALASVAAFLAILALVQLFVPSYLATTLLVHFETSREMRNALVDLMSEYSRLHATWIAGLLVLAASSLPKLKERWSFPIVVWIGSLAVLVLRLGKHPGNFLVYYEQLLTPFLLVLLAAKASEKSRSGGLVGLLLFAGTLPVILQIQRLPLVEPTSQWKHWEERLAPLGDVLVSPLLAEIAHRQGKKVYDTGHSEYGRWIPRLDWMDGAELTRRQNRFLHEIHQKLREGQFELVLLQKWGSVLVPQRYLKKHYRLAGTEKLESALWQDDVEIWVPKHEFGRFKIP